MATNPFTGAGGNLTGFARDVVPVTPNDSADIVEGAVALAIICKGDAGNVVITTADGSADRTYPIAAGETLPRSNFTCKGNRNHCDNHLGVYDMSKAKITKREGYTCAPDGHTAATFPFGTIVDGQVAQGGHLQDQSGGSAVFDQRDTTGLNKSAPGNQGQKQGPQQKA